MAEEILCNCKITEFMFLKAGHVKNMAPITYIKCVFKVESCSVHGCHKGHAANWCNGDLDWNANNSIYNPSITLNYNANQVIDSASIAINSINYKQLMLYFL